MTEFAVRVPDTWRPVQHPTDPRITGWRHGQLLIFISLDPNGEGDVPWVHISVSRRDRLPTWAELVEVKEAILGEESMAIQYLPPRSEWVNLHGYCLHLWSCLDDEAVPSFMR